MLKNNQQIQNINQTAKEDAKITANKKKKKNPKFCKQKNKCKRNANKKITAKEMQNFANKIQTKKLMPNFANKMQTKK